MPGLVVLCHVARREVWEPVVDWLGGAYRVTFVDVPGFGHRPLPPGLPPSVPSLALGVQHELDERGLGDTHVVGLSLAGSVALELARIGRIRSATAISPPGFWNRREAAQITMAIGMMWGSARTAPQLLGLAARWPLARSLLWRRMTAHPELMPREVADRLLLELPRDMSHLTAAPGLALRWVRAVASYRTEPIDSGVPVTVAWGDKDAFTRYSTQARRAQQVLPSARHVTLHGCGHLAMYDDPEQVARAILRGCE